MSPQLPRITIITPSFNQGTLIEETIQSVVDQGYPNLEYIVIDGGSTDCTRNVLEQYDDQISYWVSEADRGQAHAVNKGISRATGDVIGYLNSDDLLTSNALSVIGNHVRGHTDRPAIWSFAGASFDPDGTERTFLPGTRPRLSEWIWGHSSLFQPSTFWTRQLHDEVGLFNEDFVFSFDKEFFVRSTFQFGRYQSGTDDIVSRFRVHDNSKTATILEHREQENDLIRRLVFENATLFKALLAECRHHRYQTLMTSHYECQHRFQSASLLVRAGLAEKSMLFSRQYLGAWRQLFFGRTSGTQGT